jgi:hypothetical protein
MTIGQVSPYLGILACLIATTAIYLAYVNAQLFRLQRFEYWADQFYAAAKPLVANPDTPPVIISLIEGLNDIVPDSVAPIGIYKTYVKSLHTASEPPKRRGKK